MKKRYYAKDGESSNATYYRAQSIEVCSKKDAEFSFLAPDKLDIERIYDSEFTRSDYVRLAIPVERGELEELGDFEWKKFKVRKENS